MEKPYIPIDCNFYDRIEAAIVLKKIVQLEYSDLDGKPLVVETKLKDTLVRKGEEFVILPSGEKIRMDRIISLDGVAVPKHC
jgi:Rho-binding antiterminator